MSHELHVGLIAGMVIAIATVWSQAYIDDSREVATNEREVARENEADRRENLRFVRERSSDTATERPFKSLDLEGQNLSGLRLSGAAFDNANLKNTNLMGTNFTKATFHEVSLEEAELTGADLTNASLYRADLSGSDLTGIKLNDAYMVQADLSGSQLGGADLRGAVLYEANLSGADFAGSTYVDAMRAIAEAAAAAERAMEAADRDRDGVPNERGFNAEDLDRDGIPSETSDLATRSPDELAQVSTACFDETTLWPKGFTPPPMTSGACSEINLFDEIVEQKLR
jgi:uncharacterized protein YjbI with pentapeptide repeats